MTAKLHELLGIDLQQLDDTLRQVVETDPDLPRPSAVYEGIVRLIAAGGKRLRPMMVMVGGRFGDLSRYSAVLRTAVLLEYVHMASLVHDDIIDESDMRRGELTLHKRLDVQSAIHIANYMLTRAVEWASVSEREEEQEEESARIAEIAGVVTELCLGEYEQLDNRFRYDMTYETYLNKTRRKTALLMAECLRGGAKAAHADPSVSERLGRFGEALGIAFQIRDDVLDFTQPQEALGKPAGADLRNGNVTLPVMLAMEEDEALSLRIRTLHQDSSDAEFDEVIGRIQKSGAIGRALDISHEFASRARELIVPLAEYEAYRDLTTLADYFLR